ncbi:MAG: type II toxin-antitoxin system RelE/ParE family toxin [archaeon]
MYTITFTKEAKKQLKKLDRFIQERIYSAIEKLRIRPGAHLKKLVGRSEYRLRVRNYRVIVDLVREELVILVIKIGHRKNVYS